MNHLMRSLPTVLATVLAATVLVGAPASAQDDPATDDGSFDPGAITISLVSDPPDANLTLPFLVQGFSATFPYSFGDFRQMRPGDTWSLGGLPPGGYRVLTPPSIPEHKVLGVDCAEADATSGSSGSAGSRSASIGLDPGDQVDCVFTVAGPGDLHIKVDTEPAGGTPEGEDGSLDFFVQARVGGTSGTVAVGDTWEVKELPAGDYIAQVIDTQVKWKLVSVECEESKPETPSTGDVGARLARVGIDGGDVVTCTFTLGEPGDVNITLESDPESTDPVMPFFLTLGTTPGGGDISELQAPWTWKLEDIPVGRHTVHTTGTNGQFTWKMKDVVCTEADPKTLSEGDADRMSATIGMDPAEVVDCTFTVAGPGSVKVAVDSDLPGAEGSLTFVVEGRNQRIRPSKTVKVGKSWKIDRLPADQYVSVALPDDGPGRELVRVDCAESDTTTTSSGDTAARAGRHGLDPGEEVTCTFVIAGLPKEGRWKAKNHKGRFQCAGVSLPLKASTELGNIKIRKRGKQFVGSALTPGSGKPVTFNQDPNDPHRYVGRVSFRTPEGKADFTITLNVSTARRMTGVLTAKVKTDQGTCTVRRKQTLTYAGGR